jgi:hypothetical protein
MDMGLLMGVSSLKKGVKRWTYNMSVERQFLFKAHLLLHMKIAHIKMHVTWNMWLSYTILGVIYLHFLTFNKTNMKLIWIFSKVVGLKLKIQIHVYVQQMPLLTTVGKNMTELKIWKRRHKDGEFLSLSLTYKYTHTYIYIRTHT